MKDIKGLATGIGSLPHTDAEAAVDLVLAHCPEVPFWPQLPQRGAQEGMIAQFSEHLPCLTIANNGLVFAPQDKEKELEAFYEQIITNNLEYFAISQDYAAGLYVFKKRLEENPAALKRIRYIKCHVTGPFTFAAGLKDEKGVSLLHDPVFMQVIIQGLIKKALWQIKFFEELGKVIVFIDEPYLGCFGSAYTPINREEVVTGLREVAGSILRTGTVLSGVHCCGNTDWSIFTEIREIDIINFDAYGFLEKFVLYADDLNGFLDHGGIICWGIVPTQDPIGTEAEEALVRKIKEGIDILAKKGLNDGLLASRLLVSPSCGLGTLRIDQAQRVFEQLSGVSSLLRSAIKAQ